MNFDEFLEFLPFLFAWIASAHDESILLLTFLLAQAISVDIFMKKALFAIWFQVNYFDWYFILPIKNYFYSFKIIHGYVQSILCMYHISNCIVTKTQQNYTKQIKCCIMNEINVKYLEWS